MTGLRNLSTWPLLLSVWATFLLFGAVAAPIPGVNEPHYLCKAKHYWHPDWCPQDFFLASPNAHTVFYATIGSLTTVFSFEQSAWIGRILATLVLAWGWTKCISHVFLTRWSPLWCAWFFLALAACGNFSGEWLVGGVEGKVFAYGLLLAALGEVQLNRWICAGAWTGLAITFHPVVGVWGLLAFIASRSVKLVMEWLRSRRATRTLAERSFDSAGESTSYSRATKSASTLWTAFRAFTVLFVLALPGLIPVIRLLTESVSAETRYAATYLQVYFRLAHHLDPMMFPARAYIGYAVLCLLWLSSFAWGGRTLVKKDFDGIVIWAVIFAIAGIAIGFGPRPARLMPFFAERMNLLKFYPFRLADVLVPMAVAVSLTTVLERTALFVPESGSRISWIKFPQAIMVLMFLAALWRTSSISETNRYSNEDRADWLDVCRWIDRELPADALVQSPTNGWAFKWFARRAEYVAFKDCPQDAAGIVEWNRRLKFLHQWYGDKYADNLYSASELKGLRRQTGLTHLLTDRLGPLELEPIYRNETFQLYDLRMLGD